MIKKIFAALIGGGALSALSTSVNENIKITAECGVGPESDLSGAGLSTFDKSLCTATGEKEGFPFSFIRDHADTIDSGKQLLENQFDLAPAVANLIFWAIIAAIILKFLSWAFEKFSLLIFVTIILVIGASYFGLITAVSP